MGPQEHREQSGRIHRQERLELLHAVKQGFEQLPHRLQGIIIKQRPQVLPQSPLAAQIPPHCAEEGTAQLRGLVHQKCQQHRSVVFTMVMLLAMSVMVFAVIASAA
jgi:hypothetical protein